MADVVIITGSTAWKKSLFERLKPKQPNLGCRCRWSLHHKHFQVKTHFPRPWPWCGLHYNLQQSLQDLGLGLRHRLTFDSCNLAKELELRFHKIMITRNSYLISEAAESKSKSSTVENNEEKESSSVIIRERNVTKCKREEFMDGLNFLRYMYDSDLNYNLPFMESSISNQSVHKIVRLLPSLRSPRQLAELVHIPSLTNDILE